MKKTILFTMALIFTGIACTFGQDKEAAKADKPKSQADMANNLYLSYGVGTFLYYIDNEECKANTTNGTFILGFSRSLIPVIAVGFQLSYTNIGRTGTFYDYNNVSYNSTSYDINMSDNLWQGIASIRFQYLNKPSFCMYSGVGLGVVMDYFEKTKADGGVFVSKGQKIFPSAQLTLLGFRFGRAISFYGEFGIGTNSVLNLGISYKFGEY
ncbi:MAG: hypothetical protein NTW10_06675 [Bacteroidetes bacterium]|nr:hypothetical protein [Bacteroidota bacterium]MCX6306425.1 hypothetical protein [Bacteroidota bacterium]